MITPKFEPLYRANYRLDGVVGDYMRNITAQWLLIASQANPAMLEMFRDRVAVPLRDMVPWAGEFAGKHLTAAVQVWRVSRDPALKSFLEVFVGKLISLQAEDGYLGPWPQDCRLTNFTPYLREKGLRTWDTWGHYHLMLGLLLWYEESGDTAVLDCVRRIGDLLCATFLGQAGRLVSTGSTEMNLAPVHTLCLLYRHTENQRYLDLALQLVDEFGGTDGEGKPAGDYLRQALAGKAFFQMPKPRWESLHPIMALAELYWLTGEASYRQAFEQIWWSIAEYDRHNNGGFSSGEQATGNPYHPGAIETCCTIAWMALSVEMLKLSGEAVVADELELSLLNSVLGMHSCSGRWATYNTPMDGVRRASAHQIVFQAREGSPELNCCSVNSPRGFGLLSEWALMRDDEGIILNYYGPAQFSFEVSPGLRVALIQETDYPLSGEIRLRVNPAEAARFALKLRIPAWSHQTQVSLNGTRLEGVEAGRYLRLERLWQTGEVVELRLDMSLSVWVGERECEGLASLYHGPLLLAYDQRYNLEWHLQEQRTARRVETWQMPQDVLEVPSLDLETRRLQGAQWEDWLPPLLLLEGKTAGGQPVRWCDFGSAGETGTPYRSWLPLAHMPPPQPFSRRNPGRRSHWHPD